jgi:N-acylglucosamine 2-epimerase
MDLRRQEDLATLEALFKSGLCDDVLPFWLGHGMDKVNGGIITGLGRDGEILESDKSVWFQGRAAWTFSTAYLEVEQRAEWLAAARSCIEFIEQHCFDVDGRMFFRVTREGLPVIKRKRYVFSETFAVVAMSAYSRASGRKEYAKKAFDLFTQTLGFLKTPGLLEPKFDPSNRDSDGLALHMILVSTAQELRLALSPQSSYLTAFIDEQIACVSRFMRQKEKCVLEQVGPAGEFQSDHLEGRMLNPGHSIEASWFIMREARIRGDDKKLLELGSTILDWMWDWGWDKEYGGIIYFRDALGLPVSEYWQDMKFWWPQCEAIIANLMAWTATREPRFAERFELARNWAYDHLPDPEHGEWFGYLHRDGSVATMLKGNLYKGPFHIPRMQIVCYGLVRELKSRLAPRGAH